MLYDDPLNDAHVRLAIEALSDGSSENGLVLALRDTGAVEDDSAVATLVSPSRIEIDMAFGVSS